MLVVGLITSCAQVPHREKLKVVTIDVGNSSLLTIVTSAPNVREGTRTIVALAGSQIEINGEDVAVEKTSIAGIQSEGMICDSQMCGWKG